MKYIILDSEISVFRYVVLFALYSFIGWVIEVIYRSITQRRFVNVGFLFGPFIPIYGLGAAATIILEYIFSSWHLISRFIILGMVLTTIEYLVGFFAEKIFNLTLWDYSENKLNLQGRVSLPFSILWTVLALIFVMFIHPAVLNRVNLLDDAYVKTAAILFLIYFAVDYSFSVVSLSAFRRRITYLYTEYLNIDNVEIENILTSLQRLRNAFPALNRYINNSINSSIKNRLSAFLKPIQDKIIMEMQTDGSISVEDAIGYASKLYYDHLEVFINFEGELEPVEIIVHDEKIEKLRQLLKMRVDELELSVRSANCLRAANIHSLADLVRNQETDMLKYKNFGRKSLIELNQVLGTLGLTFGMDVESIVGKEEAAPAE